MSLPGFRGSRHSRPGPWAEQSRGFSFHDGGSRDDRNSQPSRTPARRRPVRGRGRGARRHPAGRRSRGRRRRGRPLLERESRTRPACSPGRARSATGSRREWRRWRPRERPERDLAAVSVVPPTCRAPRGPRRRPRSPRPRITCCPRPSRARRAPWPPPGRHLDRRLPPCHPRHPACVDDGIATGRAAADAILAMRVGTLGNAPSALHAAPRPWRLPADAARAGRTAVRGLGAPDAVRAATRRPVPCRSVGDLRPAGRGLHAELPRSEARRIQQRPRPTGIGRRTRAPSRASGPEGGPTSMR